MRERDYKEDNYIKEEYDVNEIGNDYALFINDIANLDTSLLTKEEEYELIEKAQSGDKEAENILVEKNLKLVIHIAKDYTNKNFGSLDFLDIIQEGNIGLIHAIKKFDMSKGFRFSTYATWWINQRILRAVEEKGKTIRVPSWAVNLYSKISKAEKELEEENAEITLEELSKRTGIKESKIIQIKKAIVTPLSMDAPIDDAESDRTLGDVISEEDTAASPEYSVLFDCMRSSIIERLESLPEFDRYILCERFGLINEEKTLQDIGAAIGKTAERVRQAEKNALLRMAGCL